MAREVNRGLAYALHLFLGLLAAAVPLLGWLQNAGVVSHDFAQAWGMIIVLGVGLPALVLVPVAVVLSLLPRPPDPALLFLGGMLVLAALVLFADENAGTVVAGVYVLAALSLGIRWLVGLWKLRKSESDRSARPLRRKAWLDRAYALHLFVTVMILLQGQLRGEWLARWNVPLHTWWRALSYLFVPAAVLLPLAAGFHHGPPLLLSLLLAVGYLLPFFQSNPASYYVLLLYFVAALFFGLRWFGVARRSYLAPPP